MATLIYKLNSAVYKTPFLLYNLYRSVEFSEVDFFVINPLNAELNPICHLLTLL